ncbi:MAG: MBL fold metallo-hydrolase RNA specificity domain-containing protein [Candidatus Micrarchaeota archaeon]
MKLTFFGCCGEVGRACFLLEDRNDRLIVECGVKLGGNDHYPLIGNESIRRVKNIAVTHAHLDHVGYLPFFFMKGGNARIFSTKPTKDMTQLLLLDYHRINSMKGKRLFSLKDIDNVLKHMHNLEYEEKKRIGGLTLSLHNAGHILGSSMILVRGRRRVLFTGDVNNRGTRLLDPARRGLRAHTMVMESTYGAKTDVVPSVKKASVDLAKTVTQTLNKGGFALIPSFAVGRGQEILLTLEAYMRSGAIPKAPIYVDGMILKANKIYRQNAIYAKKEIQQSILMSEQDPFKSPLFKRPKTRHKTEVFEEPAIIVSTSGMLSGGPILRYLREVAGDHNSKLLLVGYQAEGTVGRRLLEGERKMEIDGEEIDVRLAVESISFSAHSDHQGLLQLASGVKGLKRIFLIHGEEKKREELAEDLRRYDVVLPKNGESYKL